MSGASVSRGTVVEIRGKSEQAKAYAEQVGRDLGTVATQVAVIVTLLSRGFWGRMKWLLLGK